MGINIISVAGIAISFLIGWIIIKPRISIYQSCRIILLCPGCNFLYIKGAPILVKRHPCYNTRRIIMFINYLFPFMAETAAYNSFIFILVPDTWHILPNQQAQFITPVIPALWLCFHVFTYEIETCFFAEFNIIF